MILKELKKEMSSLAEQKSSAKQTLYYFEFLKKENLLQCLLLIAREFDKA